MKGYTLIELVVVIGVTAILLLTSTSLFFTTFIGGNKTAAAETTKQAGQFAIGQMTRMLTNARKLVPNAAGETCLPNMSSVAMQNQDLSTTTLLSELDSNAIVRIASNSGSYITPDVLTVSSGPVFSCSQPADGSAPTIIVTFSLRKGVPGVDKTRDIIEIPFRSQVTLRNY